jgi:hypothetical protein
VNEAEPTTAEVVLRVVVLRPPAVSAAQLAVAATNTSERSMRAKLDERASVV